MSFHDDLQRIRFDPVIRRLAERRAESRELAEDALQETYLNVSQKSPQEIEDLSAYFIAALKREISHQLTYTARIAADDIESIREQRLTPTRCSRIDSVEHEVQMSRLAEAVLNRLECDREILIGAVPRHSPDPCRYRIAIIAAARAIVSLLWEASAISASWNATLKTIYPEWYVNSRPTAEVIDQWLSRARRDVRLLLSEIIGRASRCPPPYRRSLWKLAS
jgi:hypothetical protein